VSTSGDEDPHSSARFGLVPTEDRLAD